jgi:hypothetical protein
MIGTRRRQSRQCVMAERFVPPDYSMDSEVYPGDASEVVGVHHSWASVPRSPRARCDRDDRYVANPARQRLSAGIEIDPLGHTHDGINHVTARFGYMETSDIPRALRVLEPTKTEGLIAIDDASYFLSKIELTKGGAPTMPAWRQNLFIATSTLSADAAESFCLPRDRTLIMGSRIDV